MSEVPKIKLFFEWGGELSGAPMTLLINALTVPSAEGRLS